MRVALVLLAFMVAACGPTGGALSAPASGPPGPPTTRLAARAVDFSLVNGTGVQLNAGWNPVGLQCQQVTQLATNPLIPGMATWNGRTYTIRPFTEADLNAEQRGRRGLWIFALAATSTSWAGSNDGLGNFVNLGRGWNFVSFTTSAPFSGKVLAATRDGSSVPLSSVVLPQFQQVNADNTCTQIDVTEGGTIQPGRPYWVFAGASCTMKWSPVSKTSENGHG